MNEFLTEQFKNVKAYLGVFAAIAIFAVFSLVAVKTASNIFYMILPIFGGDMFDLSIDTYFYFLSTLVVQLLIVGSSALISYFMYSILHSIFSHYAYASNAREHLYNEINLKDSIIKGISWKFYRMKFIMIPLVSAFIALVLLFTVGFLSFNTITALAGYSIGLVSFLSMFVLLSFIATFIFSFFITGWNSFITSLGFEIAISEPYLANNTIKNRSERLTFSKKRNFLMYILNSAFALFIIVQLYKAITIMNFITLQNLHLIFTVLLVDLLIFFVLKFANNSLYIESLLAHYNSITINRQEYYKAIKAAH